LQNTYSEKENIMLGFYIGSYYVSIPIIQGGMGVGVSLSGLASAVANEGGVGVISSAGLNLIHRNAALSFPEANTEGLKKEIRAARKKTNGIIGVNIMVAMSNYGDIVRTAINEKIDIIFCGAGLPMDLPSYLTPESKTALVPIVSSARAAKIICNKWLTTYQRLPDAFVVEGPRAGGHLGFKYDEIENPDYKLENLVSGVLQVLNSFEEKYHQKIPLIAAGGIFTGKDIFDIIQKGASGVQLGTRFVTTKECDASLEFKKAYLNAKIHDVEIIQSPVGMPGRAIRNGFLEKVKAGLKVPVKCPFHCIKSCDVENSPYCIILALYNAYKGNMEKGYAFSGTNAYIAEKITTVKDIFKELWTDFEKAANQYGFKPATI